MNDCIFCNVVANEVPSYTVYEDKKTRVFLDIFGATDGHSIVVLKKHGETILDYSTDELRELMGSVQKVSRAMERAFKTNILSIGINHGEPKGVHHLHIHVMPRFENDGGQIVQNLPNRKRKEDLEHVKEKIKIQMKGV